MPYCTRDETGWTYWLTKEDLQRIGWNPEYPELMALCSQPGVQYTYREDRLCDECEESVRDDDNRP